MSGFAHLWTQKSQPIADPDVERGLIARAQAKDEAATMRLFQAYLPVLNKHVSAYQSALGTSTEDAREEARSVAFTAFLETIAQHDTTRLDRLAVTIRLMLARHFQEASGSHNPVHVPARMRARYFSLMAKADQDPQVAMSMAPEHGMTVETFLAAHEAIEGVVWYHQGASVETDDWGDSMSGEDLLVSPEFSQEFIDADNALMVSHAMAAVTEEQRDIARLYYGFTARDHAGLVDVETVAEYEGCVGSDANVAKALGSTRSTIQRKRNQALAQMRESLGVSTS